MKLSLAFFEAVETATALEHYLKYCRRKKADASVATVEGVLKRVLALGVADPELKKARVRAGREERCARKMGMGFRCDIPKVAHSPVKSHIGTVHPNGCTGFVSGRS